MRRLFSLLVVLAAASMLVVPTTSMAAETGPFQARWLEVGQGAAALYRGSCGEIALIDAGAGSADDILDTLDQPGWGRSNLAVVSPSNYESDHLGDIIEVLTAPGIPESVPVYDRGGDRTAKDTDTYREYYDLLDARGTRQPVDIGDSFNICGGEPGLVSFSVLSAGTDGTAADGVAVDLEEDRGLCLQIDSGLFDVVSCGDIGGVQDGDHADVESAVVDEVTVDLDLEIAVVNNHGSRYSSNQAYIDGLNGELSAEVAILSVGANSLGDPDPDIIDRWQSSAALFQTAHGDGHPREGEPQDGDIAAIYYPEFNHYTVTGLASRRTYNASVGLGPRIKGPVVIEPPAGAAVRYAGDDRIATAVAVSQQTYEQADNAILATAGDFPDALAGAPLAAYLAGPLLLTGPQLRDDVAAELGRLGVKQVTILGGPLSVPTQVEDALIHLGYLVKRIAGENRYATAAEIAFEIHLRNTEGNPGAYIVNGNSFADAVAAAPLAAREGRAILLVTRDSVPEVTRDTEALETHQSLITVVGGQAAVSDEVAEAVRAGERLAGATRYETSRAVAEAYLRAGPADIAWLATGVAFPDALAAGAPVAATAGLLLLTGKDHVPSSVLAFLAEQGCSGELEGVAAVGGEAAISQAVIQAALDEVLCQSK